MVRKINPKYQYYLLPLTYVFICVVASFNYTLMKNVRKAIYTITLGFLTSIIFFLIIPLVSSILFNSRLFEGGFLLIYFYSISTIVGIYIIREQQAYITNLD